MPDVDRDGQWAVVDAFLAASRAGDFDRLVAVLDPDVVLRADGGAGRPGLISVVHGAEAVAQRALAFRRFGETASRVLVNGVPGAVAWAPDGSPFAVGALTVQGGKVVAIDILADPDRLRAGPYGRHALRPARHRRIGEDGRGTTSRPATSRGQVPPSARAVVGC